jgi:O-antigen/teichoic acid export membrane protein
MLAYKLAAHYFGKQGFSEYAVARRAISTIYPVCLLGMGVALPRYIAIAGAERDESVHNRFFGASLWCVLVSVGLALTLINLSSSAFSYLIYGDASYQTLVFPISTIIAGLCFHALAYGYFRGHLQMDRANILQLVNSGMVPLVVLLRGGRSVGTVLEEIGLITIFVSVLALLFTPWQKMASNCWSEVTVLLRYGIPRMPGDFALIALLGLPTFLVAHQVGVQAAGYVAFSISVLNMIAAVFAPIGLVLLPKASGLIARGATEELSAHLSTVFRLSLIVSAFLTVLTEGSAGALLRVYLGRDFSEMATLVRIVMLGAVPYAVYTALRSAVDARHFKAVNTQNCVIALFVLAACSASLLLAHANVATRLIVPLPLSLLVLGVLTWREARRIVEP